MSLREELSPELKRVLDGEIPVDFNWNSEPHADSPLPKMIPAEPSSQQIAKTAIVCEAMRDGLHGSPRYPTLAEMREYINLASELFTPPNGNAKGEIGLYMTVGIYTGEGVVDRTIKQLLKDLDREHPHIAPIVLSLATKDSLAWAADCAAVNDKLQTIVFMGSSPSRMLAEGWTKNYVLNQLSWAVNKAVNEHSLFVIGATEHTVQTPPDFLRQIIAAQVDNGAKIFCIADTIGVARPIGAFRIVKFVQQVLKDLGQEDVLIDWHGHRDIGRSIDNTLAAIAAGANRAHLVPGGIGERAGNTPLEVFLINASSILKEAGLPPRWNLKKLSTLLDYYTRISGNTPVDHGCLSTKAFSSSLGLHIGAMYEALLLALEAKQKGYPETACELQRMSRTVYAAIDPEEVGREWQLGVDVWSGSKTVKMVAFLMGMDEPSPGTIQRVLEVAKRSTTTLSLGLISDLLQDNG